MGPPTPSTSSTSASTTLLTVPGRLTRSARRLILHLPAGWPWAAWFELTLARLRCVAYAT
jgi:hypothetical protein